MSEPEPKDVSASDTANAEIRHTIKQIADLARAIETRPRAASLFKEGSSISYQTDTQRLARVVTFCADVMTKMMDKIEALERKQ